MKNKGFKITAIILTLVAVLVTHPFLRIEAKEIRVKPITLERIQNITNNTGQLIFDGSQISYNYSIVAGQVSTTQTTVLNDIPSLYSCDLIINLTEPVNAALITLNFKTAATNNYPLNFIVEHGRVTTSNYNTLTVQALDTNIVYVKLIFSLKQLNDNYGYPTLQNLNGQTCPWVESGQTYFQIMSATMSSATQYQGEYIPKLNNILASVDGLESLMQSIVTSTSDIDTNVTAINNILNGISNKIDNLNNVSWIDFNSSFIGTTTDFDTYDTTNYRPLSANTNIVFGRNNVNATNDYGIFRLYIPIGSNNLTSDDLHVYQLNDSNVKRDIVMSLKYFTINRYSITLYFYTSQNFNEYLGGNYRWCVTIDKWDYLYDASTIKLSYLLPTDINFWTIFSTMQQLDQLSDANNSLERIIQLLENMNINVTYQDVTNIVNNYDINIDQIFNVENNINTQLQQEMQNFTPDNTGILQRLNDSSILLKSVLNQINGIEIFTIPIAVTLVGIVLLAIVG